MKIKSLKIINPLTGEINGILLYKSDTGRFITKLAAAVAVAFLAFAGFYGLGASGNEQIITYDGE